MMKKDIIWSDRAERAYGRIIDYVASEFGKTRAKKYIAKVYSEVNKLRTNPFLGQEELLLVGARFEFRHLVIEDLTKIIYRVTEQTIEIADVWDTRQKPEDLTARITE